MNQPSSLDLNDDEFLAAFERTGLAGYAFPHRAHLRLAWLSVRRFGVDRAVERVPAGIRSLAEQHGQPTHYHDTLTRAWVYAVAAADADRPRSTFDEFLDAYPQLLDKHYLLRHYSAQRLSSAEARAHWLSPDLRPIAGAPDARADAKEQHVAPPVISLAEFRRVLGHIPLPAAIIAAHDATRVHGTTVSSVATVARDPAMLVTCVRPDSRLLPIVRAAGGFAISYLSADQRSIATRFADRTRGEDVEQFNGIPHLRAPFGAPIVTGGPAWFECRLQHEFEAAGHQVICGTVVAAGMTDTRTLQRLQDAWV